MSKKENTKPIWFYWRILPNISGRNDTNFPQFLPKIRSNISSKIRSNISNSFCKASITPVIRPDRDTTREESIKPVFFIDIDGKSLTKY